MTQFCCALFSPTASPAHSATHEYDLGQEELAEVQEWFEQFEPVLPGAVGAAAQSVEHVLMAKTVEIIRDNLRQHPAVEAWRQFQPGCPEPEQIEVLNLKKKSAVYRLAGAGPNRSAVIAKRCRAATAAVERAVYDELPARLPLPALCCYGWLLEPESKYCWLFVEDAGNHAYSAASDEHRALAGRWLGTIHRTPLSAQFQARLPDRGPGHYLKRLGLAQAVLLELADNPLLSSDEMALLRTVLAQGEVMQAHWSELERFCEGWPRVLVHGDFAIKNLRLQNGSTAPALLVYDWEMAGWGVPATDLAQSLTRCASPDLEVYCSILRQDNPHVQPATFDGW